jgi:hypothetical protein
MSKSTGNTPDLKVYTNNDQAIIVWQYPKLISNCIGFSVFRKHKHESDALAEALPNKVGFEGEPHKNGEQRPSSQWPIQRFTWVDFTVNKGDFVQYKIVPVLVDNKGKVKKDETHASPWSDLVSIDTGKNFRAYFNRGIISSQFFTHMKDEFASELDGTTVKAIIGGEDNKVRNFLGGYLAEELFSILDKIAGDKSLSVYGALYELQQHDLIEKLQAIGDRAHIVLANGSFKAKGEDKNADSREALRSAGVEVFDRIVDPNHFAHNKFLVICENDVKMHVWTGSTNWTPGGLFSQVNNGLYLADNKAMADVYFHQWEVLRDAGDSSTDPALIGANAASLPGKAYPHVWFSPKAKTHDLEEATKLLNAATKGVLFLMFNPGPAGTLFNSVLDLQEQKPDLFIHGVMNQDPGGKNPLIFFHKGAKDKANWNEILPGKVSQQLGFFDEEAGAGMVTIHSKVIVIDPFTDHGTIITGSNNFGPKASQRNDDNFIMLQDPRLVEEYAVHIMAVYDHYRWRYSLSNANPNFKGLTKDPAWMENYLKGSRGQELENFWFKK